MTEGWGVQWIFDALAQGMENHAMKAIEDDKHCYVLMGN
jgi:hypothetical protein